MRDIRFRGKRKSDGMWVFGSLVKRKCTEDLGGAFYLITDEYGINDEVRPETVGEFTGFQDKHQKDIYEGDIVKFINNQLKL
jgi:hypothetical protein